MPQGHALTLALLLGVATATAQYALSLAYAVATHLQPLEDLNLPIVTLLGWVVLSQRPAPWFWPGTALMLGASSWLLRTEGDDQPAPRGSASARTRATT